MYVKNNLEFWMSQYNVFLAYILHFDMVIMMLIFAFVSSFLFSFKVQG